MHHTERSSLAIEDRQSCIFVLPVIVHSFARFDRSYLSTGGGGEGFMYRVSIMLSTLARLGLVFVCPFYKMGSSTSVIAPRASGIPHLSHYQFWSPWVQVIEK